MKRKIITTGDGSKTIQIEDWNEQYHSKHGAIQEAYHVFIKNGFLELQANPLAILEIGFGTGLNALITLMEADKAQKKVDYTGVEAFPVQEEEWAQLDYADHFDQLEDASIFEKIHDCAWGVPRKLTDHFSLTKIQMDIAKIDFSNAFHLIYFDAFGPRVQPELWTTQVFETMFNTLKKGGLLTTYSAKGSVRRAMLNVGFKVERLPGPPGKREMLVAHKA